MRIIFQFKGKAKDAREALRQAAYNQARADLEAAYIVSKGVDDNAN